MRSADLDPIDLALSGTCHASICAEEERWDIQWLAGRVIDIDGSAIDGSREPGRWLRTEHIPLVLIDQPREGC